MSDIEKLTQTVNLMDIDEGGKEVNKEDVGTRRLLNGF